MTTQRLLNKVAIITGSSSGLGRSIALAYAREGAHVVCADLRPNARPHVAAETEVATDETIRQSGARAIFVKTDVSSATDVEGLVKRAVEEYGRIDILVNNAGISLEAGRAPMRIHETPDDVWDTTMAVNVRSVFLATKAVVAQMLRQEPHTATSGGQHRGWIINLASIYGLVGGRRNISYAASKAAVVNITRQVALDYAEDKIHCNAICPGFVKTAIYAETTQNLASEEDVIGMHPWGSVGAPQDIAGAAVFLASDEAGWITGIALPVDGGYTAQ
ncbi:gluconate 5-dehydrogenase [Microdochium bolleyi]|uniref:Gluconate 5-dehydrogenase n=1 Tax=Microdochium bolleyi TaxID=196109 RepID=A0A136IL49_9PEZI|nr:gluconate 5-dehydrogenase [Microdochium bolleyi]